MIDFDFDINGFIMEDIMPMVHTNKNLPQEIKDSWINLSVTLNAEHLHDGEEEYIEETWANP